MIYVLGSNRTALTAGYALCEGKGANMPFIAFAEAAVINPLFDEKGFGQTLDDSNIDAALAIFHTHGTVIFIDTPDAADHLLGMVDAILAFAWDTPWADRQQRKEVVN